MIGQWIFQILLIGLGVLAIVKLLFALIAAKFKLSTIVEGIKKFFNVKLFVALLVGTVLTFGFGSILPYMLDQKDKAMISYEEKNISLYNKYIDEYTLAAQKQIEEYQKMQSEMARTATATQLQFWAQQTDAVGNALSNKLKEFKDYIMKSEIDINKRNAALEVRSKNMWFFWHSVQ
jgi:hypothetical protein